MVAQVNRARLLERPHQNHNLIIEPPPPRTVRNRVEWKPDTSELKKSHPSRLAGGCRCRRGWSHIHVWWVKIREGYLGREESQTHTRPPVQGSSARKISPHNFWMQKPSGIELVEKLLEPQIVSLKEATHKHSIHSLGVPAPE